MSAIKFKGTAEQLSKTVLLNGQPLTPAVVSSLAKFKLGAVKVGDIRKGVFKGVGKPTYVWELSSGIGRKFSEVQASNGESVEQAA